MIHQLNETNMTNYRILTSAGMVKFIGSEIGSWFSLEAARGIVNYSEGEMIYQYDVNGERLFEVF